MTDFYFENNNTYIKSDCFDLRQTLDCGQAFRFYKDENDFWHGIINHRKVKLFQKNDLVTLFCVNEKDFFDVFYNYFTFDIDYESIKKKLSADEILSTATAVSTGIRLLRQDKFETVCSFIFSQNNNIPRIKGIIERFCESFGEKIDDETYDFPKCEAIAKLTVDDLAPIRAGFRAKYIIDAAQKIASGEVALEKLEELSTDKAREQLLKIKGVGPKVADCILLFSCSKFDAFPVDVWIKKVMAKLYPNGLPEVTKGIEGIAQQYLFDYARSINL